MEKIQNLQHPPKKIGLVLGGGGAKGLAHVGVLKVLAESNLSIEMICGCSMGGIIGGLFASGIPVNELDNIASRLSSIRELIKLIDRTPSRKGLMVGKKVRNYLTQFIAPDSRLENTKIPLIVNAVDLITGMEIEMREGILIDCIMASAAVPGIFPAVEMGPYKLVDGGLLDDLPVRLIRNKPVDVVVAIDVHANDDGPIPDQAQHFLPVPLPEFINDLYRAEMIMTSTLTRLNLEKAPPDLLIRPAIPTDVSLLGGFHKAKEVIKAGEDAMRKALPELNALIMS